MELVLISNSKGAFGRARIGVWRLVIAIMIMAGLLFCIAYSGFKRGEESMANAIRTDPAFARTIWQEELVAQRQLLNDMRVGSQAELTTLAARTGSLQAHVTRLDALAERLVLVADLDPTEFGFTNVPGLGGPNPENSVAPKWSSLLANLDALSTDLSVREDRLDALEALIFDRRLREDMHPTGRPLKDGWISSQFGYRTHPLSGSREFHSGIDFAGKAGLDVVSVGAGIVTWSAGRWGYGNMVEINHGNGYVTRYAHNKKNLVKIGDTVAKDEPIALVGSTGSSTGPHVHFEVLHNGKVVNPRNFIKQAAAN
ncbi:MAG: murein DD-endopeptidase MepM/ murein hydrolase activator NlpD [Gammaproteobacteria bacterium]|jgi:murein DD-endopeptidase MepM/ murein hydrolase activator NlpD